MKSMVQHTNPKPAVLYVDDIKANLMLFEASFGDVYEVLLAESGKEALDMLNSKDIHVLISDQNMPGMTGNELLEKVTIEHPDVMRFMITAYTEYDTVVEAINKGHLYGFFNKPYNIDDVRHSINNSIEVRNLRIKNREMIKKLAAANDALLSLDRSKTRFLTSVTDEIRKPIKKIMAAIHLIKDKIDSQEITDLLQLLDNSVQRLEGFSESAKHLVRLNSPDFKLKVESVSLKEIVEVGIIEKGNALNSKSIEIKLDNEAYSISVKGEYDLLVTSFSTLLGYIIGHMNEDAQIFISIFTKEEHPGIEISTEAAQYSEKEKSDLKDLSGSEKNVSEKEFRMEVILAKEIISAHNGNLTFFEMENKSGFSMLFEK